MSSSQEYKVFDDYKHVISRRETYLGPSGNSERKMYLYNYQTDSLTYSKVSLNFGFLKIFDEILVNAIDNLERSTSKNRMTTIKLDFPIISGHECISIYNDGPSIKIAKYKAQPRQENETDVQFERRQAVEQLQIGKYYPEVLFTVLHSSSNYNTDEDKTRTTGGLNGLGAKLTSIFSKLFIIDVVESGKHYHQVIKNNCENIDSPTITSTSDPDSVQITFLPDWSLLDVSHQFTSLTPILKQVIAKRMFDYVHLNINLFISGNQLPKLTFSEFAQRHLSLQSSNIKLYENICSGSFRRWKICYGFASNKNDSVSYVNNVVTYDGGQHVDEVRKQITKYIKSQLKKKDDVNAKSINSKLSIMVYSIIPGVSFASQAKSALSNEKISVPKLSVDTLERFIAESGIISCLENSKVKSTNTKTTRKRITNIKKLRDAEEAATPLTKRAGKHICTLFICEGDSAQTLCDSGVRILGEAYYGSYALRGKVLNTLKASDKQYYGNKELTELKHIIGLVDGVEYKDTSSLRYQRIVCCKDADYDGSAIMGLVINFFYQRFRSLMELPDFFYEFITPVVNVYQCPYQPKSSYPKLMFFSLNDFARDSKNSKILKSDYCKYIKGLGGNSDRDIEVYFAHFDDYLIHIDCTDDETNNYIDLAYSSVQGFTDKRKDWIAGVNEESYLPREKGGEISFNDFCTIDLALAGYDTCERSIPSVVDGLKPSQRKVMYTFFNMSQKAASTSTKVFQITGKVADFAFYHHGDSSMNQTITKMGQTFCGSNNIPLLEKDGQFGSRNKLGEDASAPRYIAAYLSEVSRLIFPRVDDQILIRKSEDNNIVEPIYYVPIIPMLLVNGTVGIGTGWSSTIPMFNPLELIQYVRTWIEKLRKNEKPTRIALLPWTRYFTGLTWENDKEWVTSGVVNKINDKTYEVTEIPVGMSIDELRENMNMLIDNDILKNYTNIEANKRNGKTGKNSRNVKSKSVKSEDVSKQNVDTFDFILTFKDDAKIKDEFEVMSMLGLTKTVSKQNLVAFNADYKPTRYSSISMIFKDWFKVRLETYDNRKTTILKQMDYEILILKNKLRWSEHMDSYGLGKLRKEELEQLLVKEKYYDNNDNFEYLLSMRADCSAKYRIEELKKKISEKESNRKTYNETSIYDIWLGELDELESYIKSNY